MGISLCMIVKDEERNIKRCLESVKGVFDEIIILDTGSVDETIEIAKKYGVKIYSYSWEDDFSKARNKSIEYANNEWVFILDADEELPVETVKAINELIKEDFDAVFFKIVSFTGEQRGNASIHYNIRMFKNKKEYRFEGRIHENIYNSIIRNGGKVKSTEYEIFHFGYIPGKRMEKNIRNLRILEAALRDKPEEPFLNFNYANSLMVSKRMYDAAKYYEKALSLIDKNNPLASLIFRNYSVCLKEIGEYERALNILDEGIAYYCDYPDLYFLKGEIFYEVGLLDESKKYFEKCTRFKKVPYRYTTMKGITNYMPYINIADILELKGDYNRALEYLIKALKENTTEDVYLRIYKLLNKVNIEYEKLWYLYELLLNNENESNIKKLSYFLDCYFLYLQQELKKGNNKVIPKLIRVKSLRKKLALFLGDRNE